MAKFAQCDFSGDVATTLLDAHTTADVTPHATWVRHTSGSGTLAISNAARARATSTSTGRYYASQTPVDADYTVQATMHVFSLPTNGLNLLRARSVVTPTNTAYVGGYDQANLCWFLGKWVSNVLTRTLNTSAVTLTVGNDYVICLEVEGTALRLYIDGVLTCSATDSAISAAGFAGLEIANGNNSDSAGLHFDNFWADDIVISDGAGGTTPTRSGLLLLGVG